MARYGALVSDMKEYEDIEPEEKKQAAADVFHQYSKFTLASIGHRVRPCDLRMHLMKEISGIPSSLKRAPPLPVATSPDAMGESSSSGTIRLDIQIISVHSNVGQILSC